MSGANKHVASVPPMQSIQTGTKAGHQMDSDDWQGSEHNPIDQIEGKVEEWQSRAL